MAKAEDLTGKRFNYLTVLERDYEAQAAHPKERIAWWKCRCEACGRIKSFRSCVIKRSITCGCKKNPDKKPRKVKIKPKNKENFSGIDLTGQRFGRLVVLEYAEEEKQVFYNGNHRNTWKCQCDCGNIHYATTENLRRGDTPSCGCITKEHRRAQLKDLSGQRFGHLVVLKWLGTFNKNSRYLVRCDCGKEYVVYAQNLTQGGTTSCGCTKESHGEMKIKEILINNNIPFTTQKSFPNFKYSDTYGTPRYDFFLPEKNILIEYDGEQHFKCLFSWETEEHFIQRQKHDKEKDKYAKENGYILIRIPYTHFNDICLEDLLEQSSFILKEE